MVSIVIPVFNEAEALPFLFKELRLALRNSAYELIFVDDGSTDESLNILKDLEKNNKSIRIFSFRKNQGKAEALSLGFLKARGQYIVTMDADLQDRPDQIEKMLKLAYAGYDAVCGWRKERKDDATKVISSKFFNFIAKIFWGLGLHDYNCGLKVFSKEAVRELDLYGGMYRFIPLLVHERGFRVTEIPVIHDKRRFGNSKYGFSKLWKDLPDIFTVLFLSRYRYRPLHFFGLVGFLLFFLGIIILGYLAYIKLTTRALGPRPILFVGMILVLSGFQVFLTGFLADLFINLSDRKHKELLLKYESEKKS